MEAVCSSETLCLVTSSYTRLYIPERQQPAAVTETLASAVWHHMARHNESRHTALDFKAQWLLYVPAPLPASGLAFCIYGFRTILSVISDYFLKQR
jgi:hypothetical protein